MADTATNTNLRSPLGRVRGLGSAKGGTHHWWLQRVTSMALLPLTIWFTLSCTALIGAPHADVAAWIGRPLNATLLLLLVGIGFHHGAAGLQVVIEDYNRTETTKLVVMLAMKGAALLLAVLGAVSVLKLAV